MYNDLFSYLDIMKFAKEHLWLRTGLCTLEDYYTTVRFYFLMAVSGIAIMHAITLGVITLLFLYSFVSAQL